LNKGDKPYTAQDLTRALGKLWKISCSWKIISLGRGFYDFYFDYLGDMFKIWAAGTVNLRP